MIRRSFKDRLGKRFSTGRFARTSNVNRFSRRVKAGSETMEYEVPGFWGFYESPYVEEGDLEWTFLDDPNSLPEEAQEAMNDFFREKMNWDIDKKFMDNVGEVYTGYFDDAMKSIIPSWKGSTFVEIESPKYYNYSSDRCFAKTVIDDAVAKEIKEYIESNRAAFDNFIINKFRPSDGFIPFYSNDPTEWLKALTDMDHNELSIIFEFILSNEDSDYEGELNEDTYDYLRSNGGDYDYFLYEKNADAFQKYMKEKGFDLEEYQ